MFIVIPTVPLPPEEIKAVVAGPNSVIVAWAPPPRSHGILIKYTLYSMSSTARSPTAKPLTPQVR